jgi:hypothetical protein
MTQNAIFSPFFAMVLLTFVVWIYMYFRRLSFIASKKLKAEELTDSMLAQISPPAVSNPSNNFKNLFEVPIIFYVLVLYLFSTKQVDAVYLNAAWVFVIFRALHSAVHCTFNLINLRFGFYLVSSIALWFITIRAALAHFGLSA